MDLKYIRKTYDVPAERGARIRYSGDPEDPVEGTIIGALDARLRVRFDGETRSVLLHPTWRVEYLSGQTTASQEEK